MGGCEDNYQRMGYLAGWLMMVYLLVITKVEKRPFFWASKFGPVSHSTKIPSEKTRTRPASIIEETRCWREKKNGKKRRASARGALSGDEEDTQNNSTEDSDISQEKITCDFHVRFSNSSA